MSTDEDALSATEDTPSSDRLAVVSKSIQSIIQHLVRGIESAELASQADEDEDLRPDLSKIMAVMMNLFDRLAIVQSKIIENRLLVKEEMKEACGQVPIGISIGMDPICKLNEALQKHALGPVTTEFDTSGLSHSLTHTCTVTEIDSGMSFSSSSSVKKIAQKQCVTRLLVHFGLLG